MDERQDPDSKVVPFHRTRRSQDSEQKQPARKIFSDEDEIAAFSLGNLIDPEDTDRPAHPNGYLNDGAEALAESTGKRLGRADGDDFFDQLLTESAAGTTSNGTSADEPRPLPGSAHLPNELPGTHRSRRVGARRLLERLPAARTKTTRTHTSARVSRRRRASALTAAVLATVGIVTGTILIADAGHARRATQSASAALTVQHPLRAVKPWVAHSAKPRPARHRPTAVHPAKHTVPAPATSSGSTAAAPSSSAQVQAAPRPVYQPSPTASAASSDSGSSSRSGAGASSGGQRAGPTSVIGIGTSPSG